MQESLSPPSHSCAICVSMVSTLLMVSSRLVGGFQKSLIPMGGKASKYGSIAITLDEPYYVAGEPVRGKVHVDCREPFFANQLLLIIDGREYAEVEQRKKPLEFSNIIYANFMILHTFPNNQVLKGQYTLPFSFVLQSFLPGTFSLEINKKDHAEIKYYLKSELVSLNKEVDLRHSAQLVVREINKNTRPSSFETKIDTGSICCVPQGYASIEAFLDKKIYMSGDGVLLTCKIDNMHSSYTFVLKAAVVQILSINGEEVLPYTYRNVIFEDQLPQFRKKQASTFTVKLPLVSKKSKQPLEPSTTGRVIDCKYQVEISPIHTACCRSWSSANFILPFTIQAPGGVGIVDAPSDWHPQVYDPQLLFIPNRDSFNRRQGGNPYITAMEEDPFRTS